MRCLSPRTVGFRADGKTISWSPKEYSKQFASFQLPCGKCIECRLEQARTKAVRCVHEAKMHDHNSFVTLTYSEENLQSERLIHEHIQDFNKRLREKFSEKKIPIVYTGEYGDEKKRPHWHSLIFNWYPEDAKYKYTNDNGDKIYTSQILSDLWRAGNAEVGSVTFKSAGYVCRYAAKKLIHGKDQDHQYHPIHQFGGRLHVIGKTFLEKYYKDLFNYGYVVLDNGTKCAIPRYYEKWLKKEHPKQWEAYVTEVKLPSITTAFNKSEKEKVETFITNTFKRDALKKGHQISKNEARRKIAEERFNRLQTYLKGDL